MNTQDEYEQLKRNNRRRLIGAIVVVAIAAAVLLKVLNHRGETVPVAELDIGQTASQVQGQVMELPNPLAGSEATGASETVAMVIPPVTASEPMPPSEVIIPAVTDTPPPNETVPPVEKTVVKPVVKEEKAVVKPTVKEEKTTVKPNKQTAHKLSPQEILDGKAGKAAAARGTATGGALIQAGAFVNTQQAETQRSRLAQIGVNAKVYRATTAKGEVYRVRIGPFASNEEARRTLDKLKTNGFDGILVNQ